MTRKSVMGVASTHSVDAALFLPSFPIVSSCVAAVDSIDVMREYGIATSTGQRAFSGEEAARVAAKLSMFLQGAFFRSSLGSFFPSSYSSFLPSLHSHNEEGRQGPGARRRPWKGTFRQWLPGWRSHC